MPAYKTLTKSQTFAIEKKALENAKEKFVLDQFSIKDMVPQKSGNQMIWHYYDHIDEDQVHVLVEGVTPSTTDLVRVPVSGTIKRRGTLMPITDELMEMHENSGELHKEMSNEMGYVIGRVLEKDAFNILMNGAGTVLPFTNVDADLKLVRQALRKSNAPKITSIKTGSTKIGTKPVAAGWYGFTSIDDADIFRAAADFMPVEDYGYSQDVIDNEIGVIKSLGLRIVETEYVDNGAAVFIGEGAFASLGLSSKNRIEYIVKGLGEEGANDGLNQRGSS
ncbi:MAG: N4-gp56 family major capsid protein, partial [Epsilonproteobacteria bacterium]